MSERIAIHKVKITKIGVNITYDDPSFSSEPDEVTRIGKGDARPDFYVAMDSLLDEVVNICLLDPNGWDGANVTGLTIKHLDGDIGCVITAQNKSSDVPSPIIINTPYLDPSLVSNDLKVKLEIVMDEARAYLDGKRAQTSLLDSEAPLRSADQDPGERGSSSKDLIDLGGLQQLRLVK
jgi:hypothetical protein